MFQSEKLYQSLLIQVIGYQFYVKCFVRYNAPMTSYHVMAAGNEHD